MTAQCSSLKKERYFNLQDILYDGIACLEEKVAAFNKENVKRVGCIIISQLLELEDNYLLEQIQAHLVEYIKAYNLSYNQSVDTLIYFKADIDAYFLVQDNKVEVELGVAAAGTELENIRSNNTSNKD